VIRSAGLPVELNMLGLDNPIHLIFLGLIALLVLGPKRLPVMARSLGTGMREFRSSLTERVDGAHEQAGDAPLQVAAPSVPAAEPVAPAAAAPPAE
jgi:sec-independent protein translocase protein TatA